MKKLIISFVAIFVFMSLDATTLSVKSVDELTNDISARVSKLNSDGKKALIRIQTPIMGEFEIEGVSSNEIITRPGEYEFTVLPGIETLKFNIDKNYYDVSFADYGLSSTEEKKTYRIQLGYPNDMQTGAGTATITANYDDVVILIDGVPMGETPLKIDNIAQGEHTIAVPNINGITMRDTTVIITAGIANEIKLNLFKEKRKFAEIEYYQPVDGEGWFDFGVVTFKENGKKGLKEYTGEVLVPAQFDGLFTTDYGGYFMVAKKLENGDYGWGLYEAGKELKMPCRFCNIIWSDKMKSSRGEQLYEVCYSWPGGWGVVDINGNPVIPFEFKNLTFGKDYVIGEKEEGYYDISYVYDYDGNLLSSDMPFKGRIYAIGEEWNVPEKYFLCENKDDRKHYIVKYIDGHYKSASALPDEYRRLSYVGNGIIENDRFIIEKDGKKGLMTIDGNILIPPTFDYLFERYNYTVFDMLHDGILVGSIDRKDFVIRHDGEIIIDGAKSDLRDAYIRKVGDFRIITIEKANNSIRTEMLLDAKGNVLIPMDKYSALISVGESPDFSYIGVTPDGCAVTLDNNGREIKKIPGSNFSGIWPLEYNEKIVYAAHYQNGRSRLLDKDFNIIFEVPEGYRIQYGHDYEVAGIFKIQEDYGIEDPTGSYGYVNADGRVIANCIYGYKSNEDSIFHEDGEIDAMNYIIERYPISEGLALISLGDLYGYIDYNGNVVVPLEYTFLTPFIKGKAYGLDKKGVWHKIYRDKL